MPDISIRAKRIENSGIKNWFVATGVVNGKEVAGYGNTMWRAIDSAFRDYWVGWNLATLVN